MAAKFYEIYVDIKDWDSPEIGGGYIKATKISKNPDALVKRQEDENRFARVDLQGAIYFYGNHYDALKQFSKTTGKVDIQVRYGGSIEYNGTLDLRGNYNVIVNAESNRNRIAELSAVINDEYSPLLDDKEKKLNILNAQPVSTLIMEREQRYLTFSEIGEEIEGGSVWQEDGVSFDGRWAREDKVLPTFAADELIGKSGWIELEDNGETKKIARTWEDGGYNEPTEISYFNTVVNLRTDPPPFFNNNVNDIFVYENQLVQYLGYWNFDSRDRVSNLLIIEEYYGSTTVEYSRFRRLDDVIEYIVNQLDSTIGFDDESFAYWNSEDNPDLNNLLIAGISDIILNDAGEQPTEGSTLGELTYEEIHGLLRKQPFNMWPFLENIGGTYYYRLKHESEIDKVTGFDLTSYAAKFGKNINWSAGEDGRPTFSYKDEDRINRIKRETTAGNGDFIGQDITVPSIPGENTETIQISQFFFDIWHIHSDPEAYPTKSTSQFFICCTDLQSDSDIDLGSWTETNFDVFQSSGLHITNAELNPGFSPDGRAATDSFNASVGSSYRVTCDVKRNGTNRIDMYISKTQTGGADYASSVVILEEGSNEVDLQIDESSSNYYLMIRYVRSGFTGIATIEFKVNSFVAQSYNIRTAIGAATGENYPNAELSIANLDETHGQYNLPASPCIINVASTNLTEGQIKKNRQVEHPLPLRKPSSIDFDKRVISSVTDNENVSGFDPTEAIFPWNLSAPKIIGEF